jgi:hypothetical protein
LNCGNYNEWIIFYLHKILPLSRGSGAGVRLNGLANDTKNY